MADDQLLRDLDLLRQERETLKAQVESLKRTKGKIAERFESYIGALVPLAREHGYALAVHGSLERDIDLVAVPWVQQASEPCVLIEAIRQAVNGYIRNDPHHDAYDETATNPAKRPHGRLAWSIYPEAGVTYLDVSVMPLLASSEAVPREACFQCDGTGEVGVGVDLRNCPRCGGGGKER